MRLLLDTHVFLWFISGDKRLSPAMRDSIRDLNNEVYLSVVSLWEAIVKYQLGKLPLPQPPDSYLPTQRRQHQIASLSLDEVSVSKLANLPQIHRDPFDRMLICQALAHGLTIVTVDDQYCPDRHKRTVIIGQVCKKASSRVDYGAQLMAEVLDGSTRRLCSRVYHI